jgi:hypothetical protein
MYQCVNFFKYPVISRKNKDANGAQSSYQIPFMLNLPSTHFSTKGHLPAPNRLEAACREVLYKRHPKLIGIREFPALPCIHRPKQ